MEYSEEKYRITRMGVDSSLSNLIWLSRTAMPIVQFRIRYDR